MPQVEPQRAPGAATARTRTERLLVFASLATAASVLGLGVLLLATGAVTMGLIAFGVGLPALLPLPMLRAGVSTQTTVSVFFATGFTLLTATAWASGAALSPLWPSVLVLPSLVALLAGPGRVLPWVWTAAGIPLAVLAGDLAGWAPASFVPAAWNQPLTLLLTLVGVTLSFLVARIFESDHLEASTGLLTAQAATVELLQRLGDADEDLRQAAAELSGGQPGSSSRGAEDDAAPSLVAVMREESAKGHALVAQATATAERFVGIQERISQSFSTLSARLDDVGEIADALGRLANRLESMALGFQIEAAGVGAMGRRFAATGLGMQELAAAVTADAREIRATLDAIHTAASDAQLHADEAALATDAALDHLDILAASFERVCELVEEAASAGDGVVAATMGHLDLLRAELHRATESQATTTADDAKRKAIAQALPALIALASGAALTAAAALAALGLRTIPLFLVTLGILAALPVAVPRLRGRVRLGGHVFLLATGALVVGGAALSGGLASPVAPALVLLPLAGVFFFGQRAGLAWVVASAAAALAFFGAAHAGVLPSFDVSDAVNRVLHATLETVFILIAFGYSTWLARLLADHAGALEASERQVRDALGHVEDGSVALTGAMAALVGGHGRATPLVDRLEREARGAEARAEDTRAAFRDLTDRNRDVQRVAEEAQERADALRALLARVGDISVDLDLLAIQTAIEAVRAGQDAAAFQVLSREATRLAAAVKADASDMQRGLQLALDAVQEARDTAREASDDTRQAAAAVEDLTRAFDTVYDLAARGAQAGRTVAQRAGDHLSTLRRGLVQT